ncbi:uroporphyrin-III C-methyltransferase [Sphaerotilus natans subsp. natans DSM 6575]|uniref:uroporphyrinogen-III C-methyltransferase n=1 Tax=Sphaerotilus natans subsp. natans DSM 6575 TaxID=1286631 RepID=A0A059KIA1_9BURK|nr:uroporphyrinogen-III C-methyltransferase [Sphaerotilus natans]KDB51171.1 uroporphyrin-III C-methyltransferase [Sphaerotilus natans subsp. natans DSM 6575]SIR17735.1 uroporphyrinogen-III C-methyltransferase [Sphaerotilus natans]
MSEVRVVFVGAGPGSADLITLRGLQRLRQAEIVLADALTDPALRQEAPDAEWIDVGKRGFSAESTGQARINLLLVESARRSARVVRLKGGDPSLFGRLEEELHALGQAGIASEVVPGITSALAAAAATQQPLTRRGIGRSVAFSTAMTRTGDLEARRSADTEVFYMAGRQLPSLAERLAEVGWPQDTPVGVISRAGWPDERSSRHTVATLAEADALHHGRPTLVTVGAGARPVRPDDAPEAHDTDQAPAPAPTA